MQNLFDVHFKVQAVRDLYWATHAHELMLNPYNTSHLISPGVDWFKKLDDTPSGLIDHLSNRKNHRLGSYFEKLWAFYLSNNPSTRLIKQSTQVFEKATNRTLGEMDFIYECYQRKVSVHLEVACKYYLGWDKSVDLSHASHWIGPSCNDRLDSKYHKLINKQAVLSLQPEAQGLLTSLGVNEPVPEVVLKGILFYPVNVDSPPNGSAKGHLRGSWMRYRQAREYFRFSIMGDDVFQVLSKPNWLAPAKPRFSMTAIQLASFLDNHFAHADWPIMVVKRSGNNPCFNNPCFNNPCEEEEKHRYIVTADHWPEKNETTAHLF